MIVELSVENIAIIERASLSLGPGYTALTGETGAGKSLFIDAIELAFGARADSELVRSGAQRAIVDVTLDLSNQPRLLAACQEMGVALEDQTLYLQREVFAEGRSQCRIGGKLAPLATLRTLGGLLVDLHGQHDHQSLLHAERHLGFVDAWIGEPIQPLLHEVSAKLDAVRAAERKLAALRSSRRDREHRLDLLRFQVSEIQAVMPREGEFDELEGQAARLRHAEKLALASADALERLSESEGNAYDQLATAVQKLEDGARLDPSLEAVIDPLRSAMYTLQDALPGVRAYHESIESDPQRLEEVQERIESLKRLRRKYGDDEVAVLAHLATAEEELAALESGEEGEESLAAEVESLRAALVDACARLTALRKAHSAEFAARVRAQLVDLAMEKAQFDVVFGAKDPETDGADATEFCFSANAGEPMRPLAKIASGGEISRVMLAIKTALAGRAGVPTLIFDEVDVGLGGRAAAVVAKKLEELAQFYQVIVISHLPQIASRATTHFHIAKGEAAGRVTTEIRALTQDQRVEEIARMLAGEAVTDAARANAREMLGV